MHPLPFDVLLEWILAEYREHRSILGIPEAQFYVPDREPICSTTLYGSRLATPIGPAAGPHTQLAQNIVAAWVCGGRFIELKTVQVMDELEIPRPCIDMADEGYNVEWSQELRLAESSSEYTKAWALVHVLRRLLGLERRTEFGTIFNMSVGYNLEGILSSPMQGFIDRLEDASEELSSIREELGRFPEFADLEIPDRLVNSVTLSTMHGCPPNEIEKIARYLIDERRLHTTIKLNPTLLGKDRVLEILHDRLGFSEIEIPDAVFEQDLRYERAVEMIRSLRDLARRRDLSFGVKLSNTLAMANHRDVLPGDEMYMSGRALYPVTVSLFERLTDTFDGDLAVSYSAGADALNVAGLVACGALPVTAASDLLKPGGYGRLGQYIESIVEAMTDAGAADLEAFAVDRRERLAREVRAAISDERYRKTYFPHGLPKTESPLEAFDCIEAPCVTACAVQQDVPEYARWIVEGEEDRALATILGRNPLPRVTGHVCTHLCQTKCTRNNYDQPVAIRRLKRFAAERGEVRLASEEASGRKVAVVGSGPSGLAAAYFLALSGVAVTIFEAKDRPGGMLAIAPALRLPRAAVDADIDRICQLGVTIELDRPISDPPEHLLERGFDAVYIACGYAKDAWLPIPGNDAPGVYGALDFLDRVARDEPPPLGSKTVVIGGGNTAMDAARTAERVTGHPCTVLYRRTRDEMPAQSEEIHDLLAEGNRLVELVSPARILVEGDHIVGVECVRTRLGEPDESGRQRPVTIAGSEFVVDADTVLLAVGQRPDFSFLESADSSPRNAGPIVVDRTTGCAGDAVYAGGDAVRGPAIIIEACADGRRAAESICSSLDLPFRSVPWERPTFDDAQRARTKRARTRKSVQRSSPERPVSERDGFELIEEVFDPADARAEAERCLQCAAICDKCVEVCPNRANLAVTVRPVDLVVPIFFCNEGRLATVADDRVRIAQARQIVHVDELCNECGNCATFCVHPGEPFRDKPRFFLDRSAFEAESDNAYRITEGVLRRRIGGAEESLTRLESGHEYRTDSFRVRLNADGTIAEATLIAPFEGTRSTGAAIEMLVLFEGVRTSAPFLVDATARSTEGGS